MFDLIMFNHIVIGTAWVIQFAIYEHSQYLFPALPTKSVPLEVTQLQIEIVVTEVRYRRLPLMCVILGN